MGKLRKSACELRPEVLGLSVDMVSIKAEVVTPVGNLLACLFAAEFEFVLKVKQPEIVVIHTAAPSFQFLGNCRHLSFCDRDFYFSKP